MKNYHEEWTAIVNKNKYILNEDQADVIKNAVANGNRGTILFPAFSIDIAFMEEFYMSNKIFDVNKKLATGEKEISQEEKDRITKKMAEFKKEFFQKHVVPKKMTDEEINIRRNELLD